MLLPKVVEGARLPLNPPPKTEALAGIPVSKPTSIARIPAIDGLRGLAALMVLAQHLYGVPLGYGWPVSHVFGMPFTPVAFFQQGGSGVELFFVLSGFCLAYPIMARAPQPPDWKRYFVHRARRILPPYWIMYLICAAVTTWVHHTGIQPWASSHLNQAVSFSRFVQGFLLVNILYNVVFWTLVVEARWYFVLPLLMLLYLRLPDSPRRGFYIFVLTAAVSLSWSWICAHSGHGGRLQQIFSVMPSMLWMFGAGIWAASLTVYRWRSGHQSSLITWSPAIMALCIFFLVVPLPSGPGIERARHCLWTLFHFALLLASLHIPKFIRMASWKPLVAVGAFSYSLYLSHLLILELVYPVLRPLNWSPLLQLLFYQGLLGPACVGAAYLFYLFAEKPFLRKPSQ